MLLPVCGADIAEQCSVSARAMILLHFGRDTDKVQSSGKDVNFIMSDSKKSNKFRNTRIAAWFGKIKSKVTNKMKGADKPPMHEAGKNGFKENMGSVWASVKRFFAACAVKVKAFFSAENMKKIGGGAKNIWLKVRAALTAFFRKAVLYVKKLFSKQENRVQNGTVHEQQAESENRPYKRQNNNHDGKNGFKAVCMAVFAAVAMFFGKIASAVKNTVKKIRTPKPAGSDVQKNAKPAEYGKELDAVDVNSRAPEKEKQHSSVEDEFAATRIHTRQEDSTDADIGMPVMDIGRLETRPEHNIHDEHDEDEKAEEDDEGKARRSMWVRDRRPFFLVSIGVSVCRLCLLLVILAGFACLGIGLGVARAYIASAPELSVEKIENNAQTSFIYDCYGNLITEYYNLENRSWASYDEIPTMLKYAVVASEDESFFEHSGFNFKRIFASFLSNLSGGSVSGGSTITQQVLKLTLLTSQQTYKRKIQEIYLAYQLEKEYSKEEILEWYMNIMPMGGLLYGVKSAAEDYFDKDLDELTLRECAVLAGTTNAPTYYNPRLCMLSEDDGGFGEKGRHRLYARANYVLTQMYAVGFITEEEYNDALFDVDDLESEQLKVNPISKNYTYEHKYYIEYVLDELVNRLMTANGWEGKTGIEQARSLLRTGGFKIYTALDVDKQTAVENTVYSYTAWPPLKDPSQNVSAGGVEQPQCAVFVIDNSTGYIAAIVGGRKEPTIRLGLNRAYQSVLLFGSATKPLSVYGPALDRGLLGNMVYENIPVPIDGWYSKLGYPQNADKTYSGPTSVSYALVKSLNVPTVRILLSKLTPEVSYNYMRSLNISESMLSLSPSLLALGSSGSYLTEYVGAYATLANGGVYREPLSITKIVNKDGEELYNSESQIFRQVFKESTAYIITQWLHRAASKPECPIQIDLSVNPGIECAGKTGTNENVRGIAYLGYTKYYTCGVWIGHDDFVHGFTLGTSALYNATPFWRAVMNSLHEGLPDAKLYDEVPDDVIEVTVCGISGLLPNGDLCGQESGPDGYSGHKPKKEYFIKGTEPTKVCDMHTQVKWCKESGKLAGKYCSDDCTEYRLAVKLPENSEYFKLIGTEKEYLLYEYFPIYLVNGTPYVGGLVGDECYCDLHTEETSGLIAQRTAMTNKANELIRNINSNLKLSKYSTNISPLQKQQIENAIALLREKVSAPVYSSSPDVKRYNNAEAEEAYDALESITNAIFESIDRKIGAKNEYTALGNNLIRQININLLRSDYASVITVDEIIAINNDMDALKNAIDAPIYTDNEEIEMFDEEKVRSLYEALQQNSDTLFAALDERLHKPDKPDDRKVLSVFADGSTVELGSEIFSQYGIIIDASTGRILARKNAETEMYPASMTKVMFAIVAYEYMSETNIDMNTTYVTLTDDILEYIEEADAASAGFMAGESVCIKDLFYGAIMQSGTDAVLMLARYCAGSESAFVRMMNSKAAALKLKNTNFTNCIGLADVNHYSTVSDMAVILAYANNYTFLRDVMEANTYTYRATNMQEQRGIKSGLHSTRISYDMDIKASAVNGADNFGGKTGYTDESGYCLMTFAFGDKGKYIVVTGGADLRRQTVADYLYLYSTFTDMEV